MQLQFSLFKFVQCILFIVVLNIFLPLIGIPVNYFGAGLIGIAGAIIFPWLE
jgi:hypothetical protein